MRLRQLVPAPLRRMYWFANRILRHPTWIRYAWRWYASLRPGWDLLAEGTPWITYPAIAWLDTYLDRSLSVFEWGSGGSTVFFARRVKHVVSVEHDPAWYDRVRERIDGLALSNCELRLIEPEPAALARREGDFYNPESFLTHESEWHAHKFERYVEAIDALPDDSLDLVLVDGRARPSCMLRALPKVRPGAFLMLDNADWDYYWGSTVRAFLDDWDSAAFRGPAPCALIGTETRIWRKPLKKG